MREHEKMRVFTSKVLFNVDNATEKRESMLNSCSTRATMNLPAGDPVELEGMPVL